MGRWIGISVGKKVRGRNRRNDGAHARIIDFRPHTRSGDKRLPATRNGSPIEILRAWLRWLRPMKPGAPLRQRLAK